MDRPYPNKFVHAVNRPYKCFVFAYSNGVFLLRVIETNFCAMLFETKCMGKRRLEIGDFCNAFIWKLKQIDPFTKTIHEVVNYQFIYHYKPDILVNGLTKIIKVRTRAQLTSPPKPNEFAVLWNKEFGKIYDSTNIIRNLNIPCGTLVEFWFHMIRDSNCVLLVAMVPVEIINIEKPSEKESVHTSDSQRETVPQKINREIGEIKQGLVYRFDTEYFYIWTVNGTKEYKLNKKSVPESIKEKWFEFKVINENDEVQCIKSVENVLEVKIDEDKCLQVKLLIDTAKKTNEGLYDSELGLINDSNNILDNLKIENCWVGVEFVNGSFQYNVVGLVDISKHTFEMKNGCVYREDSIYFYIWSIGAKLEYKFKKKQSGYGMAQWVEFKVFPDTDVVEVCKNSNKICKAKRLNDIFQCSVCVEKKDGLQEGIYYSQLLGHICDKKSLLKGLREKENCWVGVEFVNGSFQYNVIGLVDISKQTLEIKNGCIYREDSIYFYIWSIGAKLEYKFKKNESGYGMAQWVEFKVFRDTDVVEVCKNSTKICKARRLNDIFQCSICVEKMDGLQEGIYYSQLLGHICDKESRLKGLREKENCWVGVKFVNGSFQYNVVGLVDISKHTFEMKNGCVYREDSIYFYIWSIGAKLEYKFKKKQSGYGMAQWVEFKVFPDTDVVEVCKNSTKICKARRLNDIFQCSICVEKMDGLQEGIYYSQLLGHICDKESRLKGLREKENCWVGVKFVNGSFQYNVVGLVDISKQTFEIKNGCIYREDSIYFYIWSIGAKLEYKFKKKESGYGMAQWVEFKVFRDTDVVEVCKNSTKICKARRLNDIFQCSICVEKMDGLQEGIYYSQLLGHICDKESRLKGLREKRNCWVEVKFGREMFEYYISKSVLTINDKNSDLSVEETDKIKKSNEKFEIKRGCVYRCQRKHYYIWPINSNQEYKFLRKGSGYCMGDWVEFKTFAGTDNVEVCKKTEKICKTRYLNDMFQCCVSVEKMKKLHGGIYYSQLLGCIYDKKSLLKDSGVKSECWLDVKFDGKMFEYNVAELDFNINDKPLKEVSTEETDKIKKIKAKCVDCNQLGKLVNYFTDSVEVRKQMKLFDAELYDYVKKCLND